MASQQAQINKAWQERDDWRALAEALDKLLVCYRTGRNPGALLDRIATLRAKVAAN